MITITPLDNVWVRLDCNDDIAQELSEYFTFEVPGARHMPAFRHRHWKGHIRLFKLRTHTLYRGLVPRVLEFAAARDYEVVDQTPAVPALLNDITKWGATTLPSQFVLRDYQIASIQACLTHQRQIVLSPTGSGKSLSIYATICLMQQNMLASVQHKTLVIVPTLGLAQQMLHDFREYGYTLPLHVITGGVEKATDTPITISTWQSIYEQDETYFTQFGCVIVDEVHLAKAKSLTGILERCTAASYRFGFTGTLDDTLCHRLVLEGLLGTIMTASTTHALVKQGRLAPLHIKLMVLDYPDSIKTYNRRDNKTYEDEINFLVGYEPRTACIVELVKHLKGNTLILFQFIEKQGRDLYEQICADPTHVVHYYAGSVAADEREAIRTSLMDTDNTIIVGSYGTVSLGVNMPRLQNIVFAHPSKSKYRVLQSIGRSLRVHESKTHATLYDLVDDLRIGKYVNHTFKHAQERMKYYAAEKFKTKMIAVPLTMFAHKGSGTALAPRTALNAA